jgi:hypothetical protein
LGANPPFAAVIQQLSQAHAKDLEQQLIKATAGNGRVIEVPVWTFGPTKWAIPPTIKRGFLENQK